MRSILSLLLLLLLPLSVSAAEPEKGKEAKEAQKAYEASRSEILPITPEQVRDFKERQEKLKAAMAETTPAKMTSESRVVDPSPGSPPIQIRVSPDFVSTVVITDSTGEPYPILHAISGSPELFKIEHPETDGKNVLAINPLADRGSASCTVLLKGQMTPITLQLTAISPLAKDRIVDSFISLSVMGRGPNAKEPTITGQESFHTVDKTMLSFLDGLPPAGSKPLVIDPEIPGVRIWKYQGLLYLRTKLPAIWPAWTSVVRGPSDVTLYLMPDVPSLMLSNNGSPVSISLSSQN